MSNSNLLFSEETFDQIIEDISVHLTPHWDETVIEKKTLQLTPDFDKYAQLNDQGVIKIYSARHSGQLIGYYITIVSNHLHYKNTLFAVCDMVYVDRDWRMTGVGKKLVAFAEDCLSDAGVTMVIVGSKTHTPMDTLLEDLGYRRAEVLYEKNIGEK